MNKQQIDNQTKQLELECEDIQKLVTESKKDSDIALDKWRKSTKIDSHYNKYTVQSLQQSYYRINCIHTSSVLLLEKAEYLLNKFVSSHCIVTE